MIRIFLPFLVLGTGVFSWLMFGSVESAGPKNRNPRIPWTTSRITGSLEPPPPFKTARAYPQLKFNQPVTLTSDPQRRRLFVVELRGPIYSFPDNPLIEKAELAADLSKIPGHWRTYGMAFHPQFAKNRFVYLCYVKKAGDPRGTRVSRFQVSDTDPPTIDLSSETLIIDWLSGGHNGGCLQFGPDGYLYISSGDGSDPNPADRHNAGQDMSSLLSKILRIDVDQPEAGKAYRLPPDNPFVNLPGARPEIWAYGLRNPWKMAFDPKKGDLWVGDVGWEMWEYIFRIEKGGNYGWSLYEGRQPVKPEGKRGPTPVLPPTIDHDHTEARSITGGRVYGGSKFSALQGAYIYGDYVTGKLWSLRHDGKTVTQVRHLADSPLEIIDFYEDSQGELLILDYSGTLNVLVPNPSAQANRQFPRKLSETGLFASVKDHVPAPGVIPYSINAEPWMDHGSAERLFAVPNLGTLGLYEKSNLQAGVVKGAWIYPTDTVFAKTLSLEMERGNPKSLRRLETQVLHQNEGTWRAYNYRWNEDQTDAELAPAEASDQPLTIQESAGKVTQTWHFASRTECLVCHTTRAGSILGFNVPQLNRPDSSGLVNQLAVLDGFRLFEKPLPDPLPTMAGPKNPHASLSERARAYLHTNCAHCHRRGGGGTAPFELLYELDLKKTVLIGPPTQGTFDIPRALNVAPGDPYRSVLFYRLAKLGPGHMPFGGSTVIDQQGLDLVHEWIRNLPMEDSPSITEEDRALLKDLSREFSRETALKLLSTTPRGLFLMRAFDTGELVPSTQKQVLEVVQQSAGPQVRDLFERFLPEEKRIKRLGTNIKPAELLALPGNAARGRAFFLKGPGAQCRNCHKVDGEGQEVGPDLTHIGKKYNRTQLLESILEPSKTIDPAYSTYLLETSQARLITGILVKKTETEVVVKDPQGKTFTVPAADIENLTQLKTSLMPEMLLRDMTAQEAADLLEFLISLK